MYRSVSKCIIVLAPPSLTAAVCVNTVIYMTYAAVFDEHCRILLVEDDARLAVLIQEYLEQQGFVVMIETRGDCATARILDERPDLVVLDVMLPGCDGFEICQNVRSQYSCPIIMLTARGEDIDQVTGLELGADDYVTKPVQPRVLLARIRALLRRGAPNQTTSKLSTEPRELMFGNLIIHSEAREVQLNGHQVDLTSNEFEILWLLACHAGQVLSRDALLTSLRKIEYDGVDRSVDLRISRLRKKLHDNPAQPTRIKTIRSKGYLFVAEAWS